MRFLLPLLLLLPMAASFFLAPSPLAPRLPLPLHSAPPAETKLAKLEQLKVDSGRLTVPLLEGEAGCAACCERRRCFTHWGAGGGLERRHPSRCTCPEGVSFISSPPPPP
jgi:hypothetical protein